MDSYYTRRRQASRLAQNSTNTWSISAMRGRPEALPRYSTPDIRSRSRERRDRISRGYFQHIYLGAQSFSRARLFQIVRNICTRWPLIPLSIVWFFLVAFRPIHFWMTYKESHGWSAKPHPTFSHLLVHAHNYWLPAGFMNAIEPWLPDSRGREFMWVFPIPELVEGRHPIEFELPRLGPVVRRKRRRLRSIPETPPQDQHFQPHEKTDIVSPAFLSFNVLTMASPKARMFRDLLRKYQKSRIPPAFEHLIEYNFVMASPSSHDRLAWHELDMEQEEFGDLVIMDEMETDDSKRMPENGDYGKSYRTWKELLDRAEDGRGRKALWYFKTDDDAYTVMPNLLNHLLSLDYREPTYTGSTLGCSYRPHMYYQGLGYGMSYPLVKALTDAQLTFPHTIGYEDHLTGSWMLSLPTHPKWRDVNPAKIPERSGVDDFIHYRPESPEPLTGLIRADTYGKSVSWFWWWVSKTETTITVHGMKTVKEWIEAWKYFEDLWLAPTWIGQRASSPYEWVPPDWIQPFAEEGLPRTLNVTSYWEQHHSRPSRHKTNQIDRHRIDSDFQLEASHGRLPHHGDRPHHPDRHGSE